MTKRVVMMVLRFFGVLVILSGFTIFIMNRLGLAVGTWAFEESTMQYFERHPMLTVLVVLLGGIALGTIAISSLGGAHDQR